LAVVLGYIPGDFLAELVRRNARRPLGLAFIKAFFLAVEAYDVRVAVPLFMCLDGPVWYLLYKRTFSLPNAHVIVVANCTAGILGNAAAAMIRQWRRRRDGGGSLRQRAAGRQGGRPLSAADRAKVGVVAAAASSRSACCMVDNDNDKELSAVKDDGVRSLMKSKEE
jgi:hypothetical protein